MTEEEKEELQELINLLYNGHISQYGKRKLEAYIKKQQKELDKKDKVIKNTFKYIDEHTYRDMEECEFGEAHNFICCKDCEKCIKEYFYKQVEKVEE